MKVTFLNAYDTRQFTGGVENYINNLAIGLEERGVDVGYSTLPLSISRIVVKFGYVPAFFSFALECLLKKLDTDLVHSHAWVSGVHPLLGKTPKISTAHGTSYGMIKDANWPLSRRLYYRCATYEMERIGFGSSDFVACVSDKAKDDLINGYLVPKEKVETVHMYYNDKLFKPASMEESRKQLKLPVDKPIMLMAGRIDTYQKGFDLFAQIVKRLSDLEYIPLVGGKITNSARPFLKPPIRASLVMPYGELNKRYSSANFFVVPSRYEGSAVTILEAMACGIPVVSFDTGAASYFIKNGKTGYVVPNFDVGQFAERCRELIENPEKCERMGKNARKLVKAYTIDRMARHYIRLYEKIL